jgi:hypothetical protein
MLKAFVLASAVALPTAAFACPGSSSTTMAMKADSDPAACAKKAELVGSNCSYSTTMMAQRVLSEGSPYTFAGTLASSTAALASHVAAPYTVGPEASLHVVANEVLEALTEKGAQSRYSLEGRVLEVDGVRYLVLTGFDALNS